VSAKLHKTDPIWFIQNISGFFNNTMFVSLLRAMKYLKTILFIFGKPCSFQIIVK